MNDHAEPPRHLQPVPADGTDRVQPNDVLAERAILGLCLTTPGLLAELDLTPNDFYQPRHEWLYAQLAQLAGDDFTIDPISVNTALMGKAQDYIRHGGGAPYLHQLVDDASTALPSSAHYLAHTLREHTRARRVQELGRRLIQYGTTAPEQGLDQVLADAMDDVELLLKDQLFGTTNNSLDGIQYVPISGLFTRKREATPWYVAPLIAAGRITLMYSPGKTGKSLIGMEAAAALATGRGALNTRGPNHPVHVLYIDQEMTPDDWQDRLTDMGYGPQDEEKLDTYLHLAQLQAWPAMDTPAGGRAVHREAMRVGAKVVIIDTVSKVISGEENSNDTAQSFYRNTLVALKREGMGVLVLDHTGKDIERGARGGSAKTDNIDLAFELLLRGKDLLTMRCSHHRFRDTQLDEPTFLRRQSGPLAHIVEHHAVPANQVPGTIRPTALMERVSRYIEINPGVSKNGIEAGVRGKREYVRLALELLIQEGFLHAQEGSNKTLEHRSIVAFREAEEETA